MVGVASRWNKVHRLLGIRLGPGAAVLPPSVTRIHLEFAREAGDGHVGPRKFWKECVRRLKYHNPSVPMIVNRLASASSPAKMTLYFKNPAAAKPVDAPSTVVQLASSAKGDSPAQPPMWDEQIVEIDMTGKRSGDILANFMEQTKAEAIMPTEEDEQAFKAFEDLDRIAEKDRARMKKMLDEERKAKAMLRRAKAGATA
ncbi:related to ribosomal protein MRP49 [Cephalotrichum gorgonifer]|uniref:Related to ribosomal protein MRP49 n=1 Tax=Cephalotrichum gorgonifer TaxID=2041049 RepID=A0AAE8N6J6_9PEZI|nr:related to ribosomal protein MRP49 [Cephalotrichum gorgonifer]